jgi:hypothetical protein
MVLDVKDGTGFDWVLLLVAGLGKLVFDAEFTVDSINFSTLFFFGVVTA